MFYNSQKKIAVMAKAVAANIIAAAGSFQSKFSKNVVSLVLLPVVVSAGGAIRKADRLT